MNRTNKVVVFLLIVNLIAGMFLFFFLYSFVTDPDSSFNRSIAEKIQTVAENFKPLQGLKGDKGDIGEQGAIGEQGQAGKNGKDGIDGSDGKTGVTGPPGPAGTTGVQGEEGDKGDTGEAGPVAEWRCNPDTSEWEYRYPDNEDWTTTGGACIPIEGEPR